jgi:antitoxin MazE
MKARLIPIGSPQGTRIPKPLLEETGHRDDVDIGVRAGWDEAFAAMALQGDDALLDGKELVPTRWDEEEWG